VTHSSHPHVNFSGMAATCWSHSRTCQCFYIDTNAPIDTLYIASAGDRVLVIPVESSSSKCYSSREGYQGAEFARIALQVNKDTLFRLQLNSPQIMGRLVLGRPLGAHLHGPLAADGLSYSGLLHHHILLFFSLSLILKSLKWRKKAGTKISHPP
jgi:hypothetical protein